MIAVNYTQIRENLKSYMDMTTENYEAIIVTRKDKNVVMISEEAYNNLLENAYLVGDKANYDWLIESKKQLSECKAVKRELIEEGD